MWRAAGSQSSRLSDDEAMSDWGNDAAVYSSNSELSDWEQLDDAESMVAADTCQQESEQTAVGELGLPDCIGFVSLATQTDAKGGRLCFVSSVCVHQRLLHQVGKVPLCLKRVFQRPVLYLFSRGLFSAVLWSVLKTRGSCFCTG